MHSPLYVSTIVFSYLSGCLPSNAKMKPLSVSSLLLAASGIVYAQQIAFGQCTTPYSRTDMSKMTQF
jgi:hypothetical protein